jgi:hypothetical protein
MFTLNSPQQIENDKWSKFWYKKLQLNTFNQIPYLASFDVAIWCMVCTFICDYVRGIKQLCHNVLELRISSFV